MRKTILMGLVLGLMVLGTTAPAMADRDHRGHGYHHRWHHHDHHYEAPKHRRHRVIHHHYRSGPSRRVVEHHYYSEPRYRERRHYRGHTDIPLVTVGGYPAVRIRVNH